jgi:hypothetical protein
MNREKVEEIVIEMATYFQFKDARGYLDRLKAALDEPEPAPTPVPFDFERAKAGDTVIFAVNGKEVEGFTWLAEYKDQVWAETAEEDGELSGGTYQKNAFRMAPL